MKGPVYIEVKCCWSCPDRYKGGVNACGITGTEFSEEGGLIGLPNGDQTGILNNCPHRNTFIKEKW